MRMKRIVLSLICFLAFFSASAQTPVQSTNRDSLLKRLLPVAQNDTTAVPVVDQPLFYNYNFLYKQRLDSIQKTVPLPYNEYVQQYIDIYTNRKDMIGKMLGLSCYYFPIFEKALSAYAIPLEIRYLPIIESKMEPHAVSRAGATGMWQFMFGTARAYGLNMDNFVDERKDPINASYAAAQYFRDAYEELGDWLLAIAAYNCGKGNVTRAIEKAGSRDFWQIRPFLPKETRNYVPAFIAAVYVMNYAQAHQISERPYALNLKTDTVVVHNFVALADLAKAVNHEEATLLALNPSYKKKIVNGTLELPKRIVLPKVDQIYYTKLYDVLNNDVAVDKQIILAATDDVRELRKIKVVTKPTFPKTTTYKVKPGQNLSVIADLFHVEVQDLKVWNKLVDNTIVPGQYLVVHPTGAPLKPASTKVSFITYKVKQGDTLSGIAEKFAGATVAGIKKTNNLKKAVLQPGMVLKIKG